MSLYVPDATGGAAQALASQIGDTAAKIGSLGGKDVGATSVPFADLVGQLIGAASAKDQAAHRAAAEFASGASDDIHGTMIAVKEADVAVRLAATVRTKVIDAFYELWRMSV